MTAFDFAVDMEEIYQLSKDFTDALESFQDSDVCYPPIPLVKCHGMTALLILGCYSYLVESFEFVVEKLQQATTDSNPTDNEDTAMSDASPPFRSTHSRLASLTQSTTTVVPSISVGSVRVAMSSRVTAEIHIQLISQTAQNLRASLRQFVRHIAKGPHVSLELETGEDGQESWDAVAKLTHLSQRELHRREEGIFMYLRQRR